MADAPTIAEDEVGQQISWDILMSCKPLFIGGDCNFAFEEDGQQHTIRGPIWGMEQDESCLLIEPAWTARFRPDQTEGLWEFDKDRVPFVAPLSAQAAAFKDGRVIFSLEDDRMTLFPRGWADRLKPEFVDGLPLPWERLLTLFPSVRDELKLNKPAVMAICSGRFPHLVPVISGLSKDSRILAVLEKLEDPVHKHWLLCQYLTQFLKVPNLNTRVY